MRQRLDAIRDAPLPPDETLPDLNQKQLDRIAAFELREDRSNARWCWPSLIGSTRKSRNAKP
jgi:hypothetical protein